jgi:hypothetical protein
MISISRDGEGAFEAKSGLKSDSGAFLIPLGSEKPATGKTKIEAKGVHAYKELYPLSCN